MSRLSEAEVLHELAERLPLEISPRAGKTSSQTAYRCGGIYLSSLLAKMFSCPATTTKPADVAPEGWVLHETAGWLCPSCAPHGILRTAFPDQAAELLQRLQAEEAAALSESPFDITGAP